MKKTLVLLALSLAPLSMAQEATPAEGQAPQGRPTREQVIAKFDKDGDGKLNDEEKAAAKAARPQRPEGAAQGQGPKGQRPEGAAEGQEGKQGPKGEKGQRPQRPEGAAEGQEGQGPKGPKGQKGQGPTREDVIAKFDKDGDGQLNDEEKAAAKAFHQALMQKRQGEKPEGAPQGAPQGE